MLSVDALSAPAYQPLRSPSPLPPLHTTPPLQISPAINHGSRRQGLADVEDARATAALARPTAAAQDQTYCVRAMQRRDLPHVASLMLEEGWNVNFENLAAVFDMQPQAYFVAQTSTGEIVGHVSGNRLDDHVGVLSYVIVSRCHQKQGLGSRLMKMARQALGTPVALFYSLEKAVSFHKSLHFETRRFSTLVRDFCLQPEDFAQLPINRSIQVLKAQHVDFAKINSYDSAVHGIARPEYLARWILKHDKMAYVAVDSDSGDVVGYISLSFYRGRWDITPLYADSDDIALQLLKKASQEIAEPVRVFVRIPADSSEGIKLFSSLRDVQHHRVLYLMADQPLADFTSDKIYSLSTVCFGMK